MTNKIRMQGPKWLARGHVCNFTTLKEFNDRAFRLWTKIEVCSKLFFSMDITIHFTNLVPYLFFFKKKKSTVPFFYPLSIDPKSIFFREIKRKSTYLFIYLYSLYKT